MIIRKCFACWVRFESQSTSNISQWMFYDFMILFLKLDDINFCFYFYSISANNFLIWIVFGAIIQFMKKNVAILLKKLIVVANIFRSRNWNKCLEMALSWNGLVEKDFSCLEYSNTRVAFLYDRPLLSLHALKIRKV